MSALPNKLKVYTLHHLMTTTNNVQHRNKKPLTLILITLHKQYNGCSCLLCAMKQPHRKYSYFKQKQSANVGSRSYLYENKMKLPSIKLARNTFYKFTNLRMKQGMEKKKPTISEKFCVSSVRNLF